MRPPRILVTVYEDARFDIFYEQYGPLKVFHYKLKVPWTPAVGRRLKRRVQDVFAELGDPAFVALFTNGQHGEFQEKLYRWLGFVPFSMGVYDGLPCVFYVKVS